MLSAKTTGIISIVSYLSENGRTPLKRVCRHTRIRLGTAMEYMVMLNAAGITKGSSGHYGGYVLIKPVKISEIIKLTGDSVKLPRDAKSDVLSVLGRYVYKPNLTRKVNDPHAKPKQATVEYDGSGQLENQAQRP